MSIPKIELRVNTANPTLFYLRVDMSGGVDAIQTVAKLLAGLENEGALYFARAMSLGRAGHWMADGRTLPAIIARANAAGVHFTVWTED
jgi:hypothetical protein